MKKTVTEAKTITEEKFFCDICGEEIRRGHINICNICLRHICNKHKKYDDSDISDYPVKYCTDCWNIGEVYRKLQDSEDQRHDDEIERIDKSWRTEAIEYIKNKEKSSH